MHTIYCTNNKSNMVVCFSDWKIQYTEKELYPDLEYIIQLDENEL